VHIYCDTLRSNSESIESTWKFPPQVSSCHIFARDFLPGISDLILERHLYDQSLWQLFIYFQEASHSLVLRTTGDHPPVAMVHDSPNCPTPAYSVASHLHDHLSDYQGFVKPANSSDLDKLLDSDCIGHDQIVEFTNAADRLAHSRSPPDVSSLGRHFLIFGPRGLRMNVLKHVPRGELEGPSFADIQSFGEDMRRIEYGRIRHVLHFHIG
jgi:hypothetical protein